MIRRLLMRWLPVAALALTASLATAGPAAAVSEACPAIYPRPAWCDGGTEPTYALAGRRHIGWTYLNLNYCPPGRMCAELYRVSTVAWHWNGRSWRQTSLDGGWVYVYPYTGEWRWAWTQRTGWVAVSGGRFELRSW